MNNTKISSPESKVNWFQLPNKAWINILTKLNCEEVERFRLVCKKFNLLIKYNSERFAKRKLFRLAIYDVTENGKKTAQEIMFVLNHYNFGSLSSLRSLKFDQLDYFLSRIDLEIVADLKIIVIGESTVFKILNKHFKNLASVGYLNLYIDKYPGSKEFVKFLQKFMVIHTLVFDKLCLAGQPTPKDTMLVCTRGTETFKINECKCTDFLMNLKIQPTLIANPNLKNIEINSSYHNIFEEILTFLKKKSTILKAKECFHLFYDIKFYIKFMNNSHKKKFLKFIEKLDYKINENKEKTKKNILSYINGQNCHNCNWENFIDLYLEEPLVESCQYYNAK